MKSFMKTIFLYLIVITASLFAVEEGNVLIYTDPVQITSEISPYETLTENKPVTGTLMVTHNSSLKVDEKSVKLGDASLRVKLLNQVKFSSDGKFVISIYQFELSGRKAGSYTLPPITAKVGDQVYQAPPLNLTIGEGS